jgi:hypothetical protein
MQHYALALVATFAITSCSKMSNLNEQKSPTATDAANASALAGAAVTPLALPANPNNKIAYYAFDATPTGNPVVNLPLTNFASAANEVVLFEGTAWASYDLPTLTSALCRRIALRRYTQPPSMTAPQPVPPSGKIPASHNT